MKLNGEDTDYLTLGGGAFNVVNDDNEANDQPSAEIRFEYRWGKKLVGIGPTIGMLVNARGSLYGYGGFYSDIQRDPWVVTPILGLGGYGKGNNDKDLSGVFHFMAAIDLSYQMDTGTRFGIKFAHISNAGIHDRNPGSESLLLTFTFPIDFFP
ncbi:MAG: acyloxyacyl hydrolase [Gammaproteobacteria bacterium]|nr:acyloxyacyl hydrolase [Gammaproteobacteria bacterium]NIR84134.1 acyloxyacyl hydrolase [Gammaproteobacteria bacterium]NIR89446.1 acyloxyacyl hydrolase [Gammaproteobacteria bacterium]NIU05289.1 acyloxyacyl hydrolase [Gammaproteobacteria bacterium]NIV52229.1 acyloxyacyl hydrolase [Gammaproteobacteria bacterium]